MRKGIATMLLATRNVFEQSFAPWALARNNQPPNAHRDEELMFPWLTGPGRNCPGLMN